MIGATIVAPKKWYKTTSSCPNKSLSSMQMQVLGDALTSERQQGIVDSAYSEHCGLVRGEAVPINDAFVSSTRSEYLPRRSITQAMRWLCRCAL